jgi:LmeA-like phospholipid-binding
LTKKQTRIISKVLSPAVRLFLRSQVESVENLQFHFEGGDKQILSGNIPLVELSTTKAVYQGLHISDVNLTAQDISINIKQVLLGKPLKLLQPIPLIGKICLQKSDLQLSLNSGLLSIGLIELLKIILPEIDSNPALSLEGKEITWQDLDLSNGQFKLSGTFTDVSGNTYPLLMKAGLNLAASNQLQLTLLEITLPPNFPQVNLTTFDLDLGNEVDLEQLSIEPEQIICHGSLKVLP